MALAVACAAPAVARADEVGSATAERLLHQVDIDLGNAESNIKRLEDEVANPITESRFYTLEKRLVDARVYYELKYYGNAAVLFMDATRMPGFRELREAPQVLYQLAMSLYRLKIHLTARETLEQVLAMPSAGDMYQKALGLMIEIGLDHRRALGLKAAVERAERLPGRSGDLQYSYGKGLYRLGRSLEALTAFSLVQARSKSYAGAQYYIGVVATERKQFADAIAAFSRIVALPDERMKTKRDKRIRELAQLALGRLYLEQKQDAKAVDVYQEIDRNSPNFHIALYEMSWAYIHRKQLDKALNALEILLLTCEEEQLATKANVLRGRLNILLEQGDLAIETYNDIVQKFAPLRDELDRFAQKPGNLAGYFAWLLRRREDNFQVGAVLSERASKWIETDEQLKDVVNVFDDMSYARRDVKETEGMVAELEHALTGQNLIEIFPQLKAAWTRIIVQENGLIGLSKLNLDAQGQLAVSRMSPSEKGVYDVLVSSRRRPEEEFERMPKTVGEFEERLRRVNRRFGDLRRDVFLVENELKQVRDQLQAMEKWIYEARYSEKGKKLDKDQEQKLLDELEREKAELRKSYEELTKVKERITAENTRVGAGDFVASDESSLKKRLIEQHRKEAELLEAPLARLAGDDRRFADALRNQSRRLTGNIERLQRLLSRLQTAASARVADYKRQVDSEKQLIAGYRREVDGFQKSSDQFARDIGVPLFQVAHKRLSEVVLEADLGLVDVAWKRKRVESDKISELQKERTEQLQQLEETLQKLIKD